MHKILLLLPCVLLCSCVVSLKTERAPGVSVTDKHVFYVERHPKEDWGLHQMLADEIAMLGYKASAGEPGGQPPSADAIVTYDDKWWWDLSPYMLELNLHVLDARTRSMIVKTRNYRTSLARRNPRTMAKETVRATFGLPHKLSVWVPSHE
jgi:hypothetical protein